VIVEVQVEGEPTLVAVMVDAVRRVVDIAQEDIQAAPAFGMLLDVIPGMVRVDGALIILLDLAAIVATDGELLAADLFSADRSSSIRAGEQADAQS
jgi:purine-binding chemotaxis protein CheW